MTAKHARGYYGERHRTQASKILALGSNPFGAQGLAIVTILLL